MSKKLRLETERFLQTKDEEKEEQDKLKLMKERMYAAIVWKTLSFGIRIQDLKENYYDEALELIKTYLIPEDVLTKNTEMINDPVSVDSFLRQCHFQMKDSTSLVAFDQNKIPEELVGVCLLRVIHKEDYGRVFSSTIMRDGEAQEKCVRLRSAVQRKVDIYTEFNCEVFLRIYSICIKPTYRKKAIGFSMMRCAIEVARSLHIPVVMGIFNNNSTQKCAKKIQMSTLYEISYVSWRSKDDSTVLIFDDPGPGNYTIALMAGLVPPEPIPDPPKLKPIVKEVIEEKKPTLTRKDRREIQLKHKK